MACWKAGEKAEVHHATGGEGFSKVVSTCKAVPGTRIVANGEGQSSENFWGTHLHHGWKSTDSCCLLHTTSWSPYKVPSIQKQFGQLPGGAGLHSGAAEHTQPSFLNPSPVATSTLAPSSQKERREKITWGKGTCRDRALVSSLHSFLIWQMFFGYLFCGALLTIGLPSTRWLLLCLNTRLQIKSFMSSRKSLLLSLHYMIRTWFEIIKLERDQEQLCIARQTVLLCLLRYSNSHFSKFHI